VSLPATACLDCMLAIKHIANDDQECGEKNGGDTFARSATSLAESLTTDRQDR
jgi:hypothetical protein